MDFGGWGRLFSALLSGILILCTSCYSDKAPNYSFAKPGITAPPISYFDYIVIGGGTAGCALAATLSQSSDVLLIERGGVPYGNQNVEDIGSFRSNLQDDTPTSPAQRFISEDGVINARARVLGGGSAINAGFYTRASQSYVEEVGWDHALVNQSYEWAEKKVAFEPPMLQFQSAVRDGLLEVGVQPYNGFTYDHIYGTKVGGTIFDRNGKRHTAADLLEYADPKRTSLYLNSTAHKILFSSKGSQKPRAIGVLFADALGIMHRAFLRAGDKNELILSAGSLGSPQLLMLSGIGPADELTMHGIDVILNQPMVGQGMADNPMNGIFITSPSPVEVSLIQVVGITRFGSYIEASSGSSFAGAFPHNLPQANEIFPHQNNRSTDVPSNEKTIPDTARTYDSVQSLINGTIDGGLVLQKIMGPSSRGFLHLTTTNPNDNPSVTFNYFQEPDDLERCVKGMELVTNVIESKSFSRFRLPFQTVQSLFSAMVTLPLNLRPKHLDSAFSLEQFCKDTVMTIWHYHGGCQVGKVVDKDYRLNGVDALRVIDGSTFLNSPGANPQATVMMLGRYMGQRILEERGAH